MSTGNYSQPWNPNNGLGGPTCSTTLPAPPTSSPVRDSVSRVEELTATLHQCLSELEGRLDTILEPAPPSTVADGKSQPMMGSHVRNRIDTLAAGIQDAIGRVQRLHQRIEL